MIRPVPVHRLRNGAEHFYTMSKDESDGAIANYGYVYEAVAFYVLADDAGLAGEIAPETQTMRDSMAIQIMGGIISANIAGRLAAVGGSPESACADAMSNAATMAKHAYEAADAMLYARK